MMNSPTPPQPVPESPEVVRHRLRRGTRLALSAGAVAAILTPALMSGVGPTSVEAACPSGQVQTFSKYAGTVCVDKPTAATKAVAQVTIGCVVGSFAGTLPGLLAGCAVAGVGLITN